MKKVLFCVLAILIAFLPASCVQASTQEDGSIEEPVYHQKIVWELETRSVETWGAPMQYGKHLYLIESSFVYDSSVVPTFMQVSKIDLESGSYVWKSPEIQSLEETSAVLCGPYVCVQIMRKLLIFSDFDGSLLATIKLGENDGEAKDNMARSEDMLVYDGKLYWTNVVAESRVTAMHNDGLVKFDPSWIDFKIPANTEQIIKPEVVWGTGFCLATPFEYNGVIYLITKYSDWEGSLESSRLVAIDAETEKVIWERTLPSMTGIPRHPFILDGDRLYVVDRSLGCYNLHTGETIYEEDYRNRDYSKYVGIAASIGSAGVYYYKNRLYYTTDASYLSYTMVDIPKEHIKNILCVNAADGSYIWGDLVPLGGSLGTRPIVANGKAFYVTDSGLRVYNADTGVLIGVDKNVCSFGYSKNACYNEMMIYLNAHVENRKATLTAISTE